MGWAQVAGQKIPCGSPTISEYNTTTIKNMWPMHPATSSKDRWKVRYSIGIAILGNSVVQKKEEEMNLESLSKKVFQFVQLITSYRTCT